MPKISVSVVMPALNEKDNIVASIDNTLAAFDRLGVEGEVIVVDDGSTDTTPQLVAEKMKQDSRVRVITHHSPKGIGTCFWDGLDSARYDIVTMIPGDNENDPLETLCYVGLLEHVDIVIPFAYNKNIRPFLRNVLSSIYLFIINTTFKTSFNYTNSTVIYRKSILRQLKSRNNSFFYQTDILMRLTKAGYLFSEVPYRLGLRKTGESKAISISSLLQVSRGYLKLVKDIYFKGKGRDKRYKFIEDSASAKRYKSP